MLQPVTGTGRAARAGTEAAETVSADPPGRAGGSMLEDEGHQAKDAPPITAGQARAFMVKMRCQKRSFLMQSGNALKTP